jgi:putative MATE family efflux protein
MQTTKRISIKKELYRLTLPIFIDIALVMMLGAVDTVMLSRFSDDAVAAVGLDNQLISLVFLIYQFFSMGAAILCAQYYGAGLRSRFIQIVGISVFINMLLGMLMSLTLWIWAEPILQMFGLRENLMADGVRYLKITGALSFFQALSLTFSAVLRSTGKTLYPMLATVAVNILNICGNYALIFGNWGCPAMGVEGAAWATAGSRIVAMLILLCFMPTSFSISAFTALAVSVSTYKTSTFIKRLFTPSCSNTTAVALRSSLTLLASLGS